MLEYLTAIHHRQGDRHIDALDEHRIDRADFIVHLIAAFRAFDVLAAEEAIAGVTAFLSDYRDEGPRFVNRHEFHELCWRLADRRGKPYSSPQTYTAANHLRKGQQQ